MKKIFLSFLAIALLLCVSTAVWAVVEGTPHDVRIMTGSSESLEPCAMCHSPHKGAGTYPLWNRTQPAQVYTMYASVTFDMENVGGQPQSPSSLCLVCHNGVASTLVNYPGPGGDADFTNDYLYDWDMAGYWGDLGTVMTDDHPISFSYNPALDTATDDNGFPAVTTDARGRNIIDGVSGVRYPLYDNNGADPTKTQMECSTCHSVHNTATYAGQGLVDGQVNFLRGTNEGSALCMDCHTKR